MKPNRQTGRGLNGRRRWRLCKSLVLAGALCCFPQSVSLMGANNNPTIIKTEVTVQVRDDYTNLPVKGATIWAWEDEKVVTSDTTNSEGRAVFDFHALEYFQENNLKIAALYPNPIVDHFNVEIHLPSKGPLTICLYNLLGRELARIEQDLDPGFYSIRGSLEGLSAGTYILSVSNDQERQARRIVSSTHSANNIPRISIGQITPLTNEIGQRKYSLTIQKQSYDSVAEILLLGEPNILDKELSRNNELSVRALNGSGEEKALSFLLNQQEAITPHAASVKSGYYTITQSNESILPSTTQIPSRDTTLTLKETRLQLVYPNQKGITSADATINNYAVASDDQGRINTHAENKEYTLRVNDERTHQLDTLLNLWGNHQIVLEEIISLEPHELTLDLSKQTSLELKLEDLLDFSTGKDTAWVTTQGNAEVNQGIITPRNNKYSEVIPITIHAVAENGTYKEFQTQITTRPITPRTTIVLRESDTETIQPGYLILGDTIPAPTGTKEIHTPSGITKIQTGLTHPKIAGLKWSYIRTTPITENQSDTTNTYNVDFYLRDINKQIVDSLNIHGLSLLPSPDEYHSGPQPGVPSEHKMGPNRFAELMRYLHFEGRRNKAPPINEPRDTIPQGERYYLNTLNRWNTSMNGVTPDTIKIYKEVTNMERYSIPELYTSTMQEETLQTIIEQHHKWIEPLTGKIPLKIEETINSPATSQLNTVMILPDNRLREWTGGWTGWVSVSADIYANVKSGRILLQTNPELSNMIGTVNHETYSTTILNAMTRTDLRTQEISNAIETIMYAAGTSVTPTLYDLKMGRIVYQLAYEPGEPIENILKLPLGYEYVPYTNPNLVQYQKKENIVRLPGAGDYYDFLQD